jgi:fucose permease
VGALKPENRSSAMNFLHSFFCTGSVVAVVVAAGTIRLEISWRMAALALSVLPLLVFIGFCLIYIPPMAHEQHAEGRHRLRDMITHPAFLLSLAAIAFGGATEMGMASWLPAYAETTLGFTRFHSALAFTGFLAAMAIGRITLGMIGNPTNVTRVMIGCCVASVILFLSASFAAPVLALLSCIFAGFAGSALWPSMLAVTADRYPRGGASMFGALAAAGNVGAVLMPWLVGLTADHYSMRLGLSTGAVPPLLMVVTLLALLRSKR